MDDAEHQQQFVLQLTECQNRIYAYIFSMLGDHARASDVLQETNLVLWQRAKDWSCGAPFLPWAFAVARFQVLANLRDRSRERCILDSELIETLSQDVAAESSRLEETRVALRGCLSQLTEQNRSMIQLRYEHGKSIVTIAETLQRSEEAVKVTLLRIRRSLHACVTKQLSTDAAE